MVSYFYSKVVIFKLSQINVFLYINGSLCEEILGTFRVQRWWFLWSYAAGRLNRPSPVYSVEPDKGVRLLFFFSGRRAEAVYKNQLLTFCYNKSFGKDLMTTHNEEYFFFIDYVPFCWQTEISCPPWGTSDQGRAVLCRIYGTLSFWRSPSKTSGVLPFFEQGERAPDDFLVGGNDPLEHFPLSCCAWETTHAEDVSRLSKERWQSDTSTLSSKSIIRSRLRDRTGRGGARFVFYL